MDSFDETIVRDHLALPTAKHHATWQRENLFILLDVRETMFSPQFEGDTQSNSSIQALLRDCISPLVRAKLYSGSEDDISIILYNVGGRGTSVACSGGLQGVHQWQPLAPASIDVLESLSLSLMEPFMGSEPNDESEMAEILLNALTLCALEAQEARYSFIGTVNRVVVCTTNTRAPESGEFDGVMTKIYKIMDVRKFLLQFVLPTDEDCSDLEASCLNNMLQHSLQVQRDKSNLLAIAYPKIDSGIFCTKDMAFLSQIQCGLRHQTFSLTMTIGNRDPVVIGVKYTPLAANFWPKCASGFTWLDPVDSSFLVSKIANPDDDDVQHTPVDEPMYYPKLSSFKKGSNVPQISISQEQLSDLRYPMPRGMTLLGFKKSRWLQNEWLHKESQWLFPDDTLVSGSTIKFSGLAAAMQDKDVCALCILVKSERSEPRLVSLVPFPRQYQSLGLGMIELPYCDDIRHPEERTEFLGSPVSSDEQTIRLASEIIQENQIPSQYSSGGIHNPQARRHFTILECVATGGEWNDESQLPQLDKEMLLVQNDRKEYLIASFVEHIGQPILVDRKRR